jgi:hypothetical protein
MEEKLCYASSANIHIFTAKGQRSDKKSRSYCMSNLHNSCLETGGGGGQDQSTIRHIEQFTDNHTVIYGALTS